jgi:hypothetical protein
MGSRNISQFRQVNSGIMHEIGRRLFRPYLSRSVFTNFSLIWRYIIEQLKPFWSKQKMNKMRSTTNLLLETQFQFSTYVTKYNASI